MASKMKLDINKTKEAIVEWFKTKQTHLEEYFWRCDDESNWATIDGEYNLEELAKHYFLVRGKNI